MVVYVGTTDPYWEQRQLRELGQSIASSIAMVREAKQAKQDRIDRSWKNAMELMRTQPDQARVMLESMRDRYPKLLKQLGYDADKMIDIAEGRIMPLERQEAAYDAFGQKLTDAMNNIAQLRQQAKEMPDVIAQGVSGVVMTPMGPVPAPMTTTPNPAKARIQAEIDKLDQPGAIMQGALQELEAENPLKLVELQMFLNDKDVSLSELGYAINWEQVSEPAYTLNVAKTLMQDPEMMELARVHAGLKGAPRKKEETEWQAQLARLRELLEQQTAEKRGIEARKTEAARRETVRARGEEDRATVERRAELGVGVTRGTGQPGGAPGAQGEVASEDEVRALFEKIAKPSGVSAGRVSMAPEIKEKLIDRAMEYAKDRPFIPMDQIIQAVIQDWRDLHVERTEPAEGGVYQELTGGDSP